MQPSYQPITSSALRVGVKSTGKVRDTYRCGGVMVLVTTDRLSAFDRHLCDVPHKGAVLNQTSAWWMRQTAHLCPNALLAVPHPNVTVMRTCQPFKVEVVVRAYLTGTTGTSVWSHYAKGARSYCGYTLPEGMKKNEALPGGPWVTPTTKEETHDTPISGAEVVSSGLMSPAHWECVRERALAVFNFGVGEAAKRGLILVDTKYEFGLDEATGEILLIDEVHTPDSSRYWLAGSYQARLGAGQEPENIDKEFLRLWFKDNCDPYGDATLPAAPPHLVAELSARYIQLYETITGCAFDRGAGGAAAPMDVSQWCGPPAPRLVALVRTAGEEDGSEEARQVADELLEVVVVGEGGGGSSGGSATGAGGVAGVVVTQVAVEVYACNAAEHPTAVLALAQSIHQRGKKGGKGGSSSGSSSSSSSSGPSGVAAAVVLGGIAGVTTAAILAHHGRVPTVCVAEGGQGDAIPRGCPLLLANSTSSALLFLKALL